MRTLDARFLAHISEAVNGSNRLLCRAIRKYGASSLTKQPLVISDDWGYLCLLEQKAIISFGTKNPKGYNSTDGGEGTVGLVFTPERLAKHSVVIKEAMNRPEVKAKHSLSKRIECNSDKGRARLRKIHARPDVKAKVSENAKRNWENPALRKRMTESIKAKSNTPESKAKRSMALKLASARPEVRARLSEMRKNRRWVSKDGVLKNVLANIVDDFLANGWTKTSPRQFSITRTLKGVENE